MLSSKILLLSLGLLSGYACKDSGSLSEPILPPTPEMPVSPTEPSTPAPLDPSRLVTQELRIPYYNESRQREISIYGKVTAPTNYREHRLPLVIVSPGFNNNLEFIADRYAPTIARQGFVTYAFDFYGGNHGSRSGGTMLEMSPFTEVDDLSAVLQHLRQQPFVDPEQIFLLGFSQGGVVSAITAATYPDQVKGLVLMNAALVLFDDAREFNRTQGLSDINNYKGQRLGRIYFERSLDYDIYSVLPRFTKPTLIIQGDSDDIVPLSYAERAHELLPSSELHVIREGRHIFSGAQDRQIYPLLEDYFRQQKR